MLVLSRKVNERIQIGDDITITIVRLSPGSVRIGIEAPPSMAILRDDISEGPVSNSGQTDDHNQHKPGTGNLRRPLVS
jgi:carbon storage regulator